MTTEATEKPRRHRQPKEGEVVGPDGWAVSPEEAAKAEEEAAETANAVQPDFEQPAEEGPSGEDRTLADLVNIPSGPLTEFPNPSDPDENGDTHEPNEGIGAGPTDHVTDNPIIPPGDGRTSAGADSQTQMDEVVLNAEDFLDLITNLEIREANHAAKLRFDKATRSAWKVLTEQLGLHDGEAKAYRLREMRLAWPAGVGDGTDVSFHRDPMQKVSITRPTD